MTQSTNNTSDSNQPTFTYRMGNLSATIWENEANERTYYRTEIVRRYTDKDGNWKTSSSFSHDELLNVAKLAERAEEYIARLNHTS